MIVERSQWLRLSLSFPFILLFREFFFQVEKEESLFLVGLSLLSELRKQQMFHSVQILFKKYKTWIGLGATPQMQM